MTRASSDAMLRGVYGSPNKARFWQMMAYKLINGDLGFKWLEATKAGQVKASCKTYIQSFVIFNRKE